jgi:exopolysaccharide biosynthesis protein
MMTLRIDPAHYTFRVHYRPGQPLTAQQWADALPDAVALVNANFFTTQHQVLGLLVADGVVYSPAMPNLGGIFQVQAGQVRVRSNIAEPYAGEPLEQAVQAYPMLVLNGKAAYPGGQPDRPTRRTVVGQDAAGRILLMATPLLGMTLADLSAYLPTTDLGLVNAFNLDGGSSTLMVIRPPDAYQISSFDPVPAVLAVYPR